jgi:hypothetical protein
MPYKISPHGPSGFTSHPKEGVRGFLSPLKSIASAVFEPATLGSNTYETNLSVLQIVIFARNDFGD